VKQFIAPFRNEIWTYVIVTALTLLIWFWAAGETREEVMIYPALRFELPDTGQWTVSQPEMTVSVRVEGSKRATQRATTDLPRRLSIAIPPPDDTGRVDLDLARELRQQAELRGTGVSVISVKPPIASLVIDEIVEVKAPVSLTLEGVQTEGEPVVEPREVTVKLPKRLLAAHESLIVEANVGQTFSLSSFEPGRAHTIPNVPLRLPESLRNVAGVSMTPNIARVTFNIRSRIQTITLNDVRVQVSSDPRNFAEYEIEVLESDNVLTDVRVSAESDLIRQIEEGSAKVAAIVQLTTRDLEEQIESKRVTYYRAVISVPNQPDRGTIVTADVGEGSEQPMIRLRIARRDAN